MVEQGRSADRDTDSVRGETPLQSGSEKRISPRNISAEHQYVRVETGKDRTRELRQLFAVDVEKRRAAGSASYRAATSRAPVRVSPVSSS